MLRFGSRFVVFLVLWLPASLRYDVGTDYLAYVAIFNGTYDQELVEGVYLWINNLVHYLGLSVQWVFVFSAFLIYFPLCFILKRKYYFYAILFYILLYLYFNSFNIIRQSIAASFSTCAVVYLEEKKYYRFVIWLVLGALFHISALIIVPLLVVCFIKYKTRTFPVFITLFGMFLLSRLDLISILVFIFETFHSKYSRYIRYISNDSYHFSSGTIGAVGGVLIKSFILFVTIFFSHKIIKDNKRKLFLVNMSIIYNYTNVLATRYIILSRLRDALMFVPLLIIGSTIKATGRYKKIMAFMLIFVNIVFFEYRIQRSDHQNFGMSIYPYYSIFSK